MAIATILLIKPSNIILLKILYTVLSLEMVNIRSLKQDFLINETIYVRFSLLNSFQYRHNSNKSFKNI